MPDYNITGPSGKKFKITGDSPPTEDELESIFSSMTPGAPVAQSAQARPVDSGMGADNSIARAQATKDAGVVDFGTFFLSTPAGKFIEGAADLPLGAAQFISESLGSTKVTEFLRERKQRQDRGQAAVDSVAPKGGVAGGAEKFLDVIANPAGNILLGGAATKGIALAPTIPGKVAQGAGLGALFGAATPATSDDIASEKSQQIAVGSLVGGAVPAALAGIKSAFGVGKNLLSTIMPGGSTRRVKELVSKSVDGKTAPVVEQLRAGGTTEQSLGRTGEPRLAAIAQKVQGRESTAVARSIAEQNSSRIATVREAGGGSADKPLSETIDKAIGARKAATSQLFEDAGNDTAEIGIPRTLKIVNSFLEKSPKETKLTSILNGVKESFEVAGPTGRVADKTSRGLISASKNIRNLIDERGPTGQRVNQGIVRELTIIKKSLDAEIGKVNTGYAKANSLFRDMSKPVNKAQIAQKLEEKLTSSLAGDADSVIQQRGAAFNTALDNERKLIAEATGFKRGSGLEQYFDKQTLTKLGGISDRLSNDAEFLRLATLGRQGASRLVGDMRPPQPPGILDRAMFIIRSILTKAGAATEDATLNKAAEIFRDPKALADLMSKTDARSVSALKKVINAIPADKIARTAPAITATKEN